MKRCLVVLLFCSMSSLVGAETVAGDGASGSSGAAAPDPVKIEHPETHGHDFISHGKLFKSACDVEVGLYGDKGRQATLKFNSKDEIRKLIKELQEVVDFSSPGACLK